MRKMILSVIVFLCVGTIAFSETAQPAVPESAAAPAVVEPAKLGITFDATWVSKYMWRGFDLYDDHAAFQPSIDIDLFGTGFSVNVWHSQACSSGFVDSQEFDYSVTYANSLLGDSDFQTDYSISWIYYDYYRISSDEADAQDFVFDFAWPNLLPYGITPTYQYSYLYAAQGGGPAAENQMEGSVHTMGFTYDIIMPQELPPLTFSWNIAYNDGQGGRDIDHDWSHIVWGLSTSVEVGPGSLTPAVYFQNSMDKSVNDEDELWTGLSYTLSF